MTGPLLYPKADHHTQWVGKGSVAMPMDHVKWVQHSTETAGGWPSYTYGGVPMGSAPTATYEPWVHMWRQHFYINQSARALENDGDHYTNRVDVVQTEISCYCDPALAHQYGHFVEDLDQQAIDDLGDFAAWMHAEWGMALDYWPAAINWPPYDGKQPFSRMEWGHYETFSGILGHVSVPGNSHLDPGSLDNRSILARAQQGSGQGEQHKWGAGAHWPALAEPTYRAFEAKNGWADFAKSHPHMPEAQKIADDQAALWKRMHDFVYPQQ